MLNSEDTIFESPETIPSLSASEAENVPRDLWFWLALGISVVLHPLLQPTLLFSLMFFGVDGLMPISFELKQQLLFLIFLFTFGVPMLGIYLLYLVGYVRNLQMHDRSDRILPMMLTSGIYLGITWLFQQNMRNGTALIVLMAAITVALLCATVISLFWKISAHAIGGGGMLGSLLALAYLFPQSQLLYPTAAVSLAVGALLTARLHLNAHTPAQIWAGATLGGVVGFVTIFVFL